MDRIGMIRWNQVIWCAIGSAIDGLASASCCRALMFTLRPGTVFASKPSYKAADRLSIEAIETIVEGPALEQRDTFCLYNLFDRQRQAFNPRAGLDSLPQHRQDVPGSLNCQSVA